MTLSYTLIQRALLRKTTTSTSIRWGAWLYRVIRLRAYGDCGTMPSTLNPKPCSNLIITVPSQKSQMLWQLLVCMRPTTDNHFSERGSSQPCSFMSYILPRLSIRKSANREWFLGGGGSASRKPLRKEAHGENTCADQHVLPTVPPLLYHCPASKKQQNKSRTRWLAATTPKTPKTINSCDCLKRSVHLKHMIPDVAQKRICSSVRGARL